MSPHLQHHTNIALKQGHVVGRRDFLRQITATGLAAGACNWTDVISASADDLRLRGMACILLWMQGGPSQFETFSPKPDHANGGETKAIKTNVAGIQIAEHLPHCAKVMDELAIIRSMTSKEGNHQRASYLLHHGYLPMGGVKFPTLGSNVAHQIGDAANQLPSYVRIGGRLPNGGNGGFLGVDYDPLVLKSAERMPRNSTPVTTLDRYHRRLGLLDSFQTTFAAGAGAQVVADHRKLTDRAAEMILSPSMKAFDLEQEPSQLREAYGEGNFASGCQMARRLVEHGVTFVEVVSNGWDTHQDVFSRTAELTSQVDQPMAMLVKDLKARGMLDKTLVVWMGEFGRTPRVNARAGRDHYPKAFNAVVAGGGVRGGNVIGASDKIAGYPIEDKQTPENLAATIYETLGIPRETGGTDFDQRPHQLYRAHPISGLM